MIILRTLAHGMVSHAGVRFTEWAGAFPLFGLGAILALERDVFARNPTFSVLLRWAEQGTWANVLLAICFLRVLALGVNGSLSWFRKSPHLRNAVSWIALGFWTLMWNGVYMAYANEGGLPTGVVMYAFPIIIEFRNVYVSAYDMQLAGEE